MANNSVTPSQLKAKWHKDKEYYRHQEVGSGVQSFVKSVLSCPLLFNLKEGALSTPLANRKNEFIHEKLAKQQRQADFVLYADPDIVIPLEVELYGAIEEGEEQLLQYQADFEKDYGILTDGCSWCFYNGDYIEREFTLDNFLKEPELLREYWKEYIKPKYYYLRYFEKAGQQELFKKTRPVEKYLHTFFKDLTSLIESFMTKLRLEGYFNGSPQRERKKKAVEITYAYVIQFILYKTLVDNAFGNFQDEYRKDIKAIHRYIKNESYKDVLGIIARISGQISENIYKPFSEEQKYISRKFDSLFKKRENTVSDVSPWLDIYVFIKKYDFQDVETEVFGVIYENYLKCLYEDKKLGQYFTDPQVVNFMLKQIGYTPETIKARVENGDTDKLSVIDPACGSGTFLYSAVNSIVKAFPARSSEKAKEIEKLVNDNVFGLDIAEFPLYLAEMSMLMRILPLIFTEKYNNPIEQKIKLFYTKDSIAEFKGSGIESKEEIKGKHQGQLQLGLAGQEPLVESYMRDSKDLYDMKYSLQKRGDIPRRRFDFVIANPPYVSYNMCSKQKLLSFQWIKKGELKLNNIYGVNLHSIPDNPKKYRPNPNLYAFFIALGLALLKDDAKICYIIPQTILTAGDLDTIRYHLSKYVTIEKIFVFNSRLFVGRGEHRKRVVPTSSLVFIATNKVPDKNHKVEIVCYRKTADLLADVIKNLLKNRHVDTKTVKQSELSENATSWNFITKGDDFVSFCNGYNKNTEDISIYYDHKIAQFRFASKFFFDSGYSIDEKKVLTTRPKDSYYIYPKLNTNLWSIKEYRGFWLNIRTGSSPVTIKLRQANQGYNLLDSKHKVIWSYINPLRFHFTSIPVIWARNRFCAIGSDNKAELQYLFGILNSPITNFILNSNLRSEQEKDYLVSVSSIKQFIQVPKITKENQYIKTEIIKLTEEMLALEEKTLSDFVSFSGILRQKFDQVKVEGEDLILINNGRSKKLKIREKAGLVSKTLDEKYRKGELNFERGQISLGELQTLPVIDFQRQREVKDYIDDLVFALYFNTALTQVSLERAEELKCNCLKSEYYKMLQAEDEKM